MALDDRGRAVTPTLFGRWQTRTFLTLVIGGVVSLPFTLVAGPLPFVILAYALCIGLALDVYYDRQQQRRWDHDWPVHMQVRAAALEFGVLLLTLLPCCCTPLAPLVANPVAVFVIPVHWFSVWFAGFLMLQGPMRVLFPLWRFRGGRLL